MQDEGEFEQVFEGIGGNYGLASQINLNIGALKLQSMDIKSHNAIDLFKMIRKF